MKLFIWILVILSVMITLLSLAIEFNYGIMAGLVLTISINGYLFNECFEKSDKQ